MRRLLQHLRDLLYRAELLTRLGRSDEADAAVQAAQAGPTEQATAALQDEFAHARQVVDSERR
jgi:hypothetical protein